MSWCLIGLGGRGARRADMLKGNAGRKDLDEDLSSDDDGYLKLPGGLSPKCDDSDEDKGGTKRGPPRSR